VIRIVLSSEAEADALDAFRFYEDRREGLGERFRDHLGLALTRVQKQSRRGSGGLPWTSTQARPALPVHGPLPTPAGYPLRRSHHAREARSGALETPRDP